ncbi:thiamine-binding protein [Dietzia sp. SLG310A2-38A2]|uniref:thiamine-binding protein n=1 Tax=Dietzia sp. SLG310A2-38A2 TaxID=1630643 RepID=UPI0015FB471E|nr:thiamine-binding protein [Dietzia sp. SLG310A2-38A2]MBB1031705.1 thiamine-binding protein [Dietzia sp. SLG310A2-38A2]
MLFAFSVAPTTTADESASMSEAVAEAIRVVRASGLPHETTSMFTTIEGDWDEVMPVIRAATDAVLAVSPRVSLVLKADLRPGHSGELRGKVDRVDRRLAGDPGGGEKGDDDEVVAP